MRTRWHDTLHSQQLTEAATETNNIQLLVQAAPQSWFYEQVSSWFRLKALYIQRTRLIKAYPEAAVSKMVPKKLQTI